MNTSSTINAYRRELLKMITSFLIKSQKQYAVDATRIQRVLIVRPNGRLGNQLLISPLMKEVTQTFPNARIDLFVKGGIAPILFDNYPQTDRYITLPGRPFSHLLDYMNVWLKILGRRYDIVINAVGGSSSGRLATSLARAKYKIYDATDEDLQRRYPDYRHIAKRAVYNLRKNLFSNHPELLDKPMPLLDIHLDKRELDNGLVLLHKMFGEEKPVICIYTFATGSKCYSKEWWKSLYDDLLHKYGNDYKIIEILPKENVSQIDFSAPTYYSRDLREMAALMAGTKAYIGADCGIMHLAAAAHLKTIGFFSVTDIGMYEPYGNGSRAIDTNATPVHDIVKMLDV